MGKQWRPFKAAVVVSSLVENCLNASSTSLVVKQKCKPGAYCNRQQSPPCNPAPKG